MFIWARYVPSVAKSKDADPLERWRHFESKYAERITSVLTSDEDPAMDKDEMIELASLRAKADRWRDRFFKACEGVSD